MIKVKKVKTRNSKDEKLNGYCGRIVHSGTLSLDTVAKLCSENNTVTRADALAVLDALAAECIAALKQGYTVSIGDLGTLMLTVTNSEGAADPKDWTVDMIDRVNVRYKPSVALKNAIALGAERVSLRIVKD